MQVRFTLRQILILVALVAFLLSGLFGFVRYERQRFVNDCKRSLIEFGFITEGSSHTFVLPRKAAAGKSLNGDIAICMVANADQYTFKIPRQILTDNAKEILKSIRSKIEYTDEREAEGQSNSLGGWSP